MINKSVFISFFLLLSLSSQAEDHRISSAVYTWDDLEVEKKGIRERRHVFKGYTDNFEYLQVHASTVGPGEAAHDPHTHDDREELVIIKEGTMEHTINGDSKILSPGSVTLALPGDSHGMRNVGEDQAIYYVIRWRTKKPRQPVDASGHSISVDWKNLKVKPSSKGERRDIIRTPTSMLAEFEIHATTINTGMKSHDQHTHDSDEIILVRSGMVEQIIDGKPHQAGPGSVIFLASGGYHSTRNAGEGPCEYYAFKWKLKNQ